MVRKQNNRYQQSSEPLPERGPGKILFYFISIFSIHFPRIW